MNLINYTKPAQYTNNEINLTKKEWTYNDYKILLVFPDTYDVGMSHYGFLLIFEQLSRMKNVIVDRIFMPYPDYYNFLLNNKNNFRSLHYKKHFKEFDLIAVSFAYELSYINFIKILELSEIKYFNYERENKPLIIAGGLCVYHPEILKDVVDFFYIGESEFLLEKIINHLIEHKNQKKEKILLSLKQFENLYIPNIKEESKKYSSAKLYNNFTRQLVPLTKIIHNRGLIEIMRGCLNNCRFCQPGYVYRPLRILSVDEIYELTKELYYSTGYEEITYLSLSPSDYIYINELIIKILPFIKEKKISISFPSQRIDKLDNELCNFLMQGKKSGLTLAIEAGTQKLRDKINKQITEEEIYNGVKYAIKHKWRKIKFYFMIGLPDETEDDINSMINLINKISYDFKKEITQFNITLSNFIPKPHTPFENLIINSISELTEKIKIIKSRIKSRKINISFTDPYQSHLEYIFSTGNNEVIKNLIKYIEKEKYLILQDRSEYFKKESWENFIKENFDLRGNWSKIDIGISKEYFKNEYEKFKKEKITKSCFENNCSGCGINFCRLKEIIKMKSEKENKNLEIEKSEKLQNEKIKYRIEYKRTEQLQYLSVTEIQNLWNRILRQLDIKLSYSQGFNQQPEMTFSPALPVGILSNKEYIEFFTREEINIDLIKEKINSIIKNIFQIKSITKISNEEINEINISNGVIEYIIEFEEEAKIEEEINKISKIENLEFINEKGKKKEYEIKKFIKEIKIEDNKLILKIKIINRETIPIIKFLKEYFEINKINQVIKNDIIIT
ncbi:MAG TPA: TIGR03936 family radical SAM-associated protein [bacterium]|mgnify:FL=1|nr:TIGR03936 family radical SAM-associated protein [bacterium]HOL46950.1 TIGR03936 family radical SAM-associated protein [bacterium]HPQ18215.1 TIGR03936 family radical SAM-associated protein [bacterium]